MENEFQSPSLRGSGRFLWYLYGYSFCFVVSIPFIAGQWSLPVVNRWFHIERRSFNPLHCGAVVASRKGGESNHGNRQVFQSPSLRGSGRFSRGRC